MDALPASGLDTGEIETYSPCCALLSCFSQGTWKCVSCFFFLMCGVVDGALHDIAPNVVSMHKTLKVHAMLVNLGSYCCGGRATQEKP